MSTPIEDLWDAAQEVESLGFQVSSIQTALDLWAECVEIEAPAVKNNMTWDDAAQCACFVRRFSMYRCLLRCIQDVLAQQASELAELSDALYTAARKEREGKKTEAPIEKEEPYNAEN